ncbi:MAG: hypothetical protein Q4C54_02020 [Clostridia bacterium]|nr:hypothetical protein [Clostridia bacterium]
MKQALGILALIIGIPVAIIAVCFIGYGIYKVYELYQDLKLLQDEAEKEYRKYRKNGKISGRLVFCIIMLTLLVACIVAMLFLGLRIVFSVRAMIASH